MLKYAKLYAYNKSDSNDLKSQKQLLAIIGFFLFWCGVIWWLMWYLIYGWCIPTVAAGLFGIMVLIMMIVTHIVKNHKIFVHSVFLGTFIVPLVCQWSIGTLDHSGMNLLWMFLTPLGILIFSSLRPALIYMLMFLGILVVTILITPTFYAEPMVVSEFNNDLFYVMNLVVSYSVIFLASAWFVNSIKKEKKKSEDLLLNILPSDVAEELKMNGKVEPVSHENATVLFTDFKGFTEISEGISPKDLVMEINHCFDTFDKIATSHNIEKIKTIGDSFMAVGGDFGAVECTPADVVLAALKMQEFIIKRKRERDQQGKFAFEMRVGIHTGSVIAGVVGSIKFQFDIWGDTVNIASRMESHGEIEKVNVSEVTYQLIKEQFSFKERETIVVKGKGAMKMYFADYKTPKT